MNLPEGVDGEDWEGSVWIDIVLGEGSWDVQGKLCIPA